MDGWAIEMVRELRPDVVIMDIGMPNLNGIEATRQNDYRKSPLESYGTFYTF